MANPQIEDGFTKIANEIVDNLIRQNLSGQELRLTLFVIRKTYGFNKKTDSISLSQMMRGLSINSHIRCSQLINSLERMKIITLKENIKGISKKYQFNKNFEEWNTLKKNINTLRKTKDTLKVLRKIPLRKNESTKDILTKDILTKDKVFFDIKIWKAYLKMRRKIKKPATEEAQELIIEKLEKFKEQGQDPNEILKQSIENSWQGVFPVKEKYKERRVL